MTVGIALIAAISAMSAQLVEDEGSKRVWVAINTTQCGGTENESALVRNNVRIYQTELVRWAAEDMAFCQACGCANGWAKYYEIDESAVPIALSNGFRIESPENLD